MSMPMAAAESRLAGLNGTDLCYGRAVGNRNLSSRRIFVDSWFLKIKVAPVCHGSRGCHEIPRHVEQMEWHDPPHNQRGRREQLSAAERCLALCPYAILTFFVDPHRSGRWIEKQCCQ